MSLKLAAKLAVSLLIASLLLAFVFEGLKQRQQDMLEVSPTGDLRPFSAEDINRKTLEAADALRGKQAERFLQNKH